MSRARLNESHARLEEAKHLFAEVRGDLKEEVRWLRERNEHLTDQIQRIQRFQSGMTETPREPRPQLEPMPLELERHIEQFDNSSLKRDMKQRCYRRHARGEPWSTIMKSMMTEEAEDGR